MSQICAGKWSEQDFQVVIETQQGQCTAPERDDLKKEISQIYIRQSLCHIVFNWTLYAVLFKSLEPFFYNIIMKTGNRYSVLLKQEI